MRIKTLLLLPAVLAAVLAACGNINSTPAQPDAGMPDAPKPGGCTAGDACEAQGSPGVCSSAGTCGECTDTTDDAKCTTAYGAGTLCVQGACIAATCHTSADCGGKECVDNQCVGCRSDADCDTGQVCNGSGTCVAAGNVCSGKAIGASCGAGDLCCNVGGSETCVTADCCTASDCTAITGANSSCQAGTCVPAGSLCAAPSQPTYYVDAAYSGVSTGTSACPFKTLHGAFNAVRNDAFTGDSDVVIKGGTINATSEGGASYFPLTLPSSVFVRTQAGLTPAVIVAPANTSAFEAPYVAQAAATSNWAARVSNLEIKQATAGTAGTAVHVTGGTLAKPIHLDHLEIHNFFHGVNVSSGGNADLDWGVNSHDNASTGLYVVGGRVDMVVGTDTDARSHYDSNQIGIYVGDDPASILTITATEPTTGTFAGLKTVTASSNAKNGIRLASPNGNNALTNVGVISNGLSGVTLFGGAKVKLRKLRIQSSGSSGINIVDNGTATAIGGIDIGTAGDPGHNELSSSTDSHICVNTTADNTVLGGAIGNMFGTVDCATNPNGVVRMFSDCAAHGGGVNDPTVLAGPFPVLRESVAMCTLSFQ
jgi:hypothetical protein